MYAFTARNMRDDRSQGELMKTAIVAGVLVVALLGVGVVAAGSMRLAAAPGAGMGGGMPGGMMGGGTTGGGMPGGMMGGDMPGMDQGMHDDCHCCQSDSDPNT